MGEGHSLQQMGLGKLDIWTQKNLTRYLPYSTYKDNSEWIKDLNMRHENIKLREENWENLIWHWFGIRFGSDFLDMTLKV